MHNSYKIIINNLKIALKKRKTLLKLTYSKKTMLLIKFLQLNNYISNCYWNKDLNVLILRLRYSSTNQPSISSFIVRNSRKTKTKTFFKQNKSVLQPNFIKNLLLSEKSYHFVSRFR